MRELLPRLNLYSSVLNGFVSQEHAWSAWKRQGLHSWTKVCYRIDGNRTGLGRAEMLKVRNGCDEGCRLCTSPMLSMEPGSSSRKADPQTGGAKHSLVLCLRDWSCCLAKQPVISWEQPRVVIVGAGLAGLSAAKRLVNAGLKDVIVLEALPRPGGRVHTCLLSQTKVDLGGEEIYGPNITNTAYNMAIMEQLFDHKPVTRKLKGPFYTSDGIVLFDVSRPNELFSNAIRETARIFYSPKKSRSSVKDVIKQKLKKEMDTYSELDRPDEIALMLSGIENQVRTRWGDDLSNISADFLGSYFELSEGVVRIERGAEALLGPLLAVIGDKVKYNKPVQNIRWASRILETSKRASVLCCDGEEIPCDFVVCTVSLGVLKSQAETLFSPPLPKSKRHAITNLSFSHVTKIYLEYDKPFWAPGEGVFNICWRPGEKREDWIKGIGSIEEVSSTVLRVSIAGREAVWAESCPDKTIAEELTMFLRKVLGDPSLPCPRQMVRSRWSSDIHFMGASSYLGLQSSVEDQCELMAPVPDASLVPPVLLLAGEATVPGHFSTMHGAMLSGYREADRILQICHAHNGPPKPKKVKKKKPECL